MNPTGSLTDKVGFFIGIFGTETLNFGSFGMETAALGLMHEEEEDERTNLETCNEAIGVCIQELKPVLDSFVS